LRAKRAAIFNAPPVHRFEFTLSPIFNFWTLPFHFASKEGRANECAPGDVIRSVAARGERPRQIGEPSRENRVKDRCRIADQLVAGAWNIGGQAGGRGRGGPGEVGCHEALS
jgi:hypothetical protein